MNSRQRFQASSLRVRGSGRFLRAALVLMGAITMMAGECDPKGPDFFCPFCITPQPTMGTITGTVTVGGSPQSDVTVTLTMGGTPIGTATTNASGTYQFTNVATGTKTVTPTPPSGGSCSPASQDVNVTAGGTATANFACTQPPQTGTVTGTVRVDGSPRPDVIITLTMGGTPIGTTTTGSNGGYQFTNVNAGSAQVTMTPPANTTCPTPQRDVMVPAGGTATADFDCTTSSSTFTVTLTNGSWEHPQGSSTSFECKVVHTNPAQPGASYTVQVTGPAVISGQSLSGTLNSNGEAQIKVEIGLTGTYTNVVTVGQQTASLDVTVTGSTNTCAAPASSRRFKWNVVRLFEGEVLGLRPVSFRYLPQWGDPAVPHIGLIAEEVAEAYPEAVTLDADGRPEGIFYHVLVARLTRAGAARAETAVRGAIQSLAEFQGGLRITAPPRDESAETIVE